MLYMHNFLAKIPMNLAEPTLS